MSARPLLQRWLIAMPLVASCTKVDAPSATAGVSSPSATGPCRTADDCAVVCFSGPDDCCGDACGCEHPLTKAEAKAIGEQRRRNCEGKAQDCPEARCVMKDLSPACVEGRCVAVATPAAPATGSECTADSECVMTTLGADCCSQCEPIAGTKAAIDAARARCNGRTGGPPDCPSLDCPNDPAVPRCVGGACVIRPE